MSNLLTNVPINIRTSDGENVFHHPIDIKHVVGTEIAFASYIKNNNAHVATQGYFTYVNNLQGSFLNTFGLHTCHSILIFRDGGPALISHIDNDSIICPLFMTAKLLEWIDKFGSKFNILFIEPDIDGKKKQFSYKVVFAFFSWFNKINNLNLIVARLILPPVVQMKYGGNSVSLYEQNGKTYLVVIYMHDKLSRALGGAIIKKIGNVMDKWNIDCGDNNIDFSDDFIFSCPVQDRYTRGMVGTNLIEADISQILEYVNSKVSEDEQLTIINESKNYIRNSIVQLLTFSTEKKFSEVRLLNVINKYIGKLSLTSNGVSPVTQIYNKMCDANKKRKTYDTYSEHQKVFKLAEEINLHILIAVIKVGVGRS